jgi:hypothetical protein
MHTFGRHNWALPAFLDRRLPRLSLEASDPPGHTPKARPLDPLWRAADASTTARSGERSLFFRTARGPTSPAKHRRLSGQPFRCSKYFMISAPALWPGCVSRFGWQFQVFALIEVGLSRCLSELISQPGTSW